MAKGKVAKGEALNKKNFVEDPLNAPMREKYWEELSDPEKVERMRREVKNLQCQIDLLLKKVSLLMEHSHLENGELRVRIGLALDRDRSFQRDNKYF